MTDHNVFTRSALFGRSGARRVANRRNTAVGRQPIHRPAAARRHHGRRYSWRYQTHIIGNRVDMQLTVRADNPETRELLLGGIDRVAEGVARSLGVPDDLLPKVIRSETETTPPTINHEEIARMIKDVFTAHFGEEMMFEEPREGMGAEDFAYSVEPERGVKGVYFDVGGTPREDIDTAPSHHSPYFWIEPEASIKSGVEAMVVGALALMPVD